MSKNEGQRNSLGKTAVQIIEDVTKTYNIPSYRFPAGHIHDNRALILGSTDPLM
jgi:muramoyltetrapeptide carboxypeptidase